MTHTVTTPSHRGGSHDLFGLWDHVAVATKDLIFFGETYPTGSVLWIQTKSRKQYGKDLLKYEDFPSKNKFIFVWEKVNTRYKPLIIQEL
jgi:hypothetical protein